MSKGTLADSEALSAFDGTDLAETLLRASVQRVFIAGFATEYSILKSARDATIFRFEVFVLEDAIRPFDLEPGDGERALATLQALGTHTLRFDTLVA